MPSKGCHPWPLECVLRFPSSSPLSELPAVQKKNITPLQATSGLIRCLVPHGRARLCVQVFKACVNKPSNTNSACTDLPGQVGHTPRALRAKPNDAHFPGTKTPVCCRSRALKCPNTTLLEPSRS